MLIQNITLVPEKVKKRNDRCDELKLECGEYDWENYKINDADDIFTPYDKWLKHICEYAKEHNIQLILEKTANSPVFVSDLNWNHDVDDLTLFKCDHDWLNNYYGVCDNAEQVIQEYKKLVSDERLNKDHAHIIGLTPIFKHNQPEHGGWRWEKWGEYIGVQHPSSDYLYNDPKIGMIYVYHIQRVINDKP